MSQPDPKDTGKAVAKILGIDDVAGQRLYNLAQSVMTDYGNQRSPLTAEQALLIAGLEPNDFHLVTPDAAEDLKRAVNTYDSMVQAGAMTPLAAMRKLREETDQIAAPNRHDIAWKNPDGTWRGPAVHHIPEPEPDRTPNYKDDLDSLRPPSRERENRRLAGQIDSSLTDALGQLEGDQRRALGQVVGAFTLLLGPDLGRPRRDEGNSDAVTNAILGMIGTSLEELASFNKNQKEAFIFGAEAMVDGVEDGEIRRDDFKNAMEYVLDYARTRD